MKFTTTQLVALLSMTLLTACTNTGNNIACQNPPPQYRFAFVTAQGQPLVTDSLQASSLRLTYTPVGGSKTVVPVARFRPVPSNDAYRYVYQLSYELVDGITQPQSYTIEFNEQAVGALSLAAQRNDGKCDKWMHLTEVQANKRPVAIGTDNITYQIPVER